MMDNHSGYKIKIIGIGETGIKKISNLIAKGFKEEDFIIIDSKKSKSFEGFDRMEFLKIPNISKFYDSIDNLLDRIMKVHLLFFIPDLKSELSQNISILFSETLSALDVCTIILLEQPNKNDENQNFHDILENLPGKCMTIKTPSNLYFTRDDPFYAAINGIIGILNSYYDIDLADILGILHFKGFIHMGVGEAEGEENCEFALLEAFESLTYHNFSLRDSKGLLVNFTTSNSNINLRHIGKLSYLIKNHMSPKVRTRLVLVHDQTLNDKIRVTIYASGIEYA